MLRQERSGDGISPVPIIQRGPLNPTSRLEIRRISIFVYCLYDDSSGTDDAGRCMCTANSVDEQVSAEIPALPGLIDGELSEENDRVRRAVPHPG